MTNSINAISPYLVGCLERFCTSSSVLTDMYFNLYKWQVRAEIEMAGLSSESKVLCIGSGAIPHTAIRIVQETGIDVDAIDNNSSMLTLAKRVLDHFEVLSNVHLSFGEAQSFSVDKYDAIFVANHIVPKSAILHRLVKETAENCRIIFRHSAIYGSLGELPMLAQPILCHHKFRPYTFDSWLMKKSHHST